jgi:hypothetical protein
MNPPANTPTGGQVNFKTQSKIEGSESCGPEAIQVTNSDFQSDFEWLNL